MKLFDIFKTKPKKFGDLMNNEVPKMEVKQGRATSTSTGMEFYEKYQKRETPKTIDDVKIETSFDEPMVMNSTNKARLRSGIIVSLEFKVNRKDLEFVGISRIDGKPIYLYTGTDFSHFNLPFEEVYASPEELVKPVDYSDWLARGLDNSIKYSEYVAESINPQQTQSRISLDRMKRLAGLN